METYIFLNTNDVKWEYDLLSSGIEHFISTINDFKSAIKERYVESNAHLPYDIRDKHVNINDKEKKVFISKAYIRKFLKDLSNKGKHIEGNIHAFNSHFRNDKKAIQLTLDLKEIIESDNVFESKNDYEVILSGVSENEIKSTLDSIKQEFLNVIELYTKEKENQRRDAKYSQVIKFIQPALASAFIEFEQELITEGYLSEDYQWKKRRSDLGRCIRCLYELDYLQDDDPKFFKIKKYCEESYRPGFEVFREDLLKANVIKKIALKSEKFPYTRLETLKDTRHY